MLDIRLVDFATWENARAMARADSVPDGLMWWVTLRVRGVEIQYNVGDDFAYCEASAYDRFGTDMADWKFEELVDGGVIDDRVVWIG